MLPFRAVSAALALAIGLLPLVPAEHVHEAESVDGRHEVVTHRHVGLHHGHADHHGHDHAPDADHHVLGPLEHYSAEPDRAEAAVASAKGGGPNFDDDDSVVATMDGVFVAPAAFVVVAPVLMSGRVTVAPETHTVARVVEVVERLIHGPPRAPTLLRGPPQSSRL